MRTADVDRRPGSWECARGCRSRRGTANSGPASEDGRIVRISPDGGEPTVVADTGGRPLGLHIARDGRVLICDSHRGLLALDPASGKLEALGRRGRGRQAASSARTSPKHPTAQSISPSRRVRFSYDALQGRGAGGARPRQPVPARSPTAPSPRSVDGLYFANGVTREPALARLPEAQFGDAPAAVALAE